MNLILVLLYTLVSLLTLILLNILIKYIREKPLSKQRLTDNVQIDLAYSVGTFIFYYSSLSIVREVAGPFKYFLVVDISLLIVLGSFFSMLRDHFNKQFSSLLIKTTTP